MIRTIKLILVVILFISCNNTTDDSAKLENGVDIPPTEAELDQKLTPLKCIFSDPDTSLAGIKLRDANSTTSVIGENEKYYPDEQYHYYSKNRNEILSMVAHHGDVNYSMSIFNVWSAGKTKYEYKQMNVEHF